MPDRAWIAVWHGAITARAALVLAIVSIVVIAVFPAVAADPTADRQAIHVLDRLAFGPSAEDLRHVKEVGIERYIAEQLQPAAIEEPAALGARLAALDSLRLAPPELLARYTPPKIADAAKLSPEERQMRRQQVRTVIQQASRARIWRALYSRRQLNEVMVDFWFNHFNVFGEKVFHGIWIGSYEEQAIRPHAMGKFRDLLVATARHPAMLLYLDNFQNSAPGTKLPNGTVIGLNENYARELMELHTLGVDGGYTQDDVVALARILTGWGFVRQDMQSPDGSGFSFAKQRHDFTPKHFLGRDIAPSGEAEGIEALDILAHHPATARHIAFELARYFVADQPPPALVARLAARFQETDGDITAILQSLFASQEFRDSTGSKYKTPYRYVLSAVRAAGLAVENPNPLLRQMAQLGMPLYGCVTPDGYQDTVDKWLSPDAGIKRVSFALALAGGTLPLHRRAPGDIDDAAGDAAPPGHSSQAVDGAAVQALLDPMLTANTRAAIAEAPSAERAALLLGSPDFMQR